MTLPRLPQPVQSEDDDVREIGRRARVSASDVIASLALLPPIEVRTVTLSGTFPVALLTRIQRPVAVLGGGCVPHGSGLGDGSLGRSAQVAWRRSEDETQPDIWLLDVTGPVWQAGVEWDVILIVIGEAG